MKKVLMMMLMMVLFVSLVSAEVDMIGVGLVYYGGMDDICLEGSAYSFFKMNDDASTGFVIDEGYGQDGDAYFNTGDSEDYHKDSWFGGGLDFDGSNYVDTDGLIEDVGDAPFSISFWMYPEDGQPSSKETMYGVQDLGGEIEMSVSLLTTGQIEFVYGDGDGTIHTATTNEPVFGDGYSILTNITVIADLTNGMRIFCNGHEMLLDIENDGSLCEDCFGSFESGYHPFIGALANGWSAENYFNGIIDMVSVYDRALDPSEIKFLVTRLWVDEDGPEILETAITSIKDRVGDNDGTISGFALADAYVIDGQVNSCLTFDGTNDYITVPHNASLDFGEYDSFSISLWVWAAEGSGTGYLVSKYDPATWSGYQLSIEYDTVRFVLWEDDDDMELEYDNGITEEEWCHLVITRDPDNVYLYINGVRVENNDADLDPSNTADLKIGSSYSGGSCLEGMLDEVMIFNKKLSATEVTALYDRQSAGIQTETDMWPHFEEARKFERYTLYGNGNDSLNVYPVITDFGTGGNRATASHAIGDMIVGVGDPNDKIIYVNKTARTAAQCLTDDPETDSTNWVLTTLGLYYDHFDTYTEYYIINDSDVAVLASSTLSTQVNPYKQSAPTLTDVGYKPSLYEPVELTIEMLYDRLDAIKLWKNSQDLVAVPDAGFKAMWLLYEGSGAYEDVSEGGSDPMTQPLDHEYWGCNEVPFEWSLEKVGIGSYKWVLDEITPTTPYGWNTITMGTVEATWRRVPKYEPITYDHEASNQPLIWLSEAGDPPGMAGLTGRSRIISTGGQTPYSGRLTLAEVKQQAGSGYVASPYNPGDESYDAQFGWWNAGTSTWVEGTTTVGGQQQWIDSEKYSDTSEAIEESPETKDHILREFMGDIVEVEELDDGLPTDIYSMHMIKETAYVVDPTTGWEPFWEDQSCASLSSAACSDTKKWVKSDSIGVTSSVDPGFTSCIWNPLGLTEQNVYTLGCTFETQYIDDENSWLGIYGRSDYSAHNWGAYSPSISDVIGLKNEDGTVQLPKSMCLSGGVLTKFSFHKVQNADYDPSDGSARYNCAVDLDGSSIPSSISFASLMNDNQSALVMIPVTSLSKSNLQKHPTVEGGYVLAGNGSGIDRTILRPYCSFAMSPGGAIIHEWTDYVTQPIMFTPSDGGDHDYYPGEDPKDRNIEYL